jgi:hypothetical protein
MARQAEKLVWLLLATLAIAVTVACSGNVTPGSGDAAPEDATGTMTQG